jgi:glycosyltransferase involved in cell wall biosynthesis
VLRDLVFLSCVRPFAGKTIFHFHAYGLGEFVEVHSWLKRVGLAFKKPDVAIVLGALCRSDGELLGAKKIVEIPYGMDIFPINRSSKRSLEKPRILFVGLHIESKGILDLLDTASLLKSNGLDFVVHTVGPWKNTQIRAAFESKRHELGLEEDVICCGELTGEPLWAEYAEADLFFFPTFFEFETFGLVVVEAMAYGLPVIASDWRGPGDIVEDGVTGFVCPVHDSRAYIEATTKLLSDPELRQSMGVAGRRLYEQKYRNAQFIDAVEAVFREMMAAG